MDDYLAKPVQAPELFAAIERVLSDNRVPQPIKPDGGAGTHLLDPAVLLAACDNDAEGLGKICQNFQAYIPGPMAEVADALRAQDAPRLRETAHKLCGMLSVVASAAEGVGSRL